MHSFEQGGFFNVGDIEAQNEHVPIRLKRDISSDVINSLNTNSKNENLGSYTLEFSPLVVVG